MRHVALGGHIDVLPVNLQFQIGIGHVLLCHRNVAADVLPGFLEEEWNRLRRRPRPSTSPLLSVYRNTCGAQQKKTQCPCNSLHLHHASREIFMTLTIRQTKAARKDRPWFLNAD